LYVFSNNYIIRVIEFRRMGCKGHAARMERGEMNTEFPGRGNLGERNSSE
jgi:hypothetical protein